MNANDRGGGRSQGHSRPVVALTDAPLADPSLGSEDAEPINILVVDDEPKNLTVLQAVLDDADYRLVRAESADQALMALIADQYALIILDVRMPGMSGFELAQMIKERRKTARVPIIFLTAYYGEDQHVLEGYGVGAVDYLHKPVNPAILRSKVAVFAELYRKTRQAVRSSQALLAEVTQRRRAEEQLARTQRDAGNPRRRANDGIGGEPSPVAPRSRSRQAHVFRSRLRGRPHRDRRQFRKHHGLRDFRLATAGLPLRSAEGRCRSVLRRPIVNAS